MHDSTSGGGFCFFVITRTTSTNTATTAIVTTGGRWRGSRAHGHHRWRPWYLRGRRRESSSSSRGSESISTSGTSTTILSQWALCQDSGGGGRHVGWLVRRSGRWCTGCSRGWSWRCGWRWRWRWVAVGNTSVGSHRVRIVVRRIAIRGWVGVVLRDPSSDRTSSDSGTTFTSTWRRSAS